MSKEDVELVRRAYEAFERGDIEAIVADVHPDVVTWAHPRGEEGRYEGRDGVRRFIEDWLEPFEEFSMVTEEFRDAGGGKVLVRTLQTGRGRGSGVPVEDRFWLLHRVRDGKAFRIDLYGDETEALEAAGLSKRSGS
jgi:ketosteroid isomerase-like protein